MPNDHVVAARVRFAGGPSWVLLPEFPSIGYHRRNATTATCFTSDRRTVQVSFVLADPPAVSRWSVHCPGRPNKMSAEILNAAAGLVLIRIAFSRGDGPQQATDYFVYRAGPGEPSLHLIPGPCPEAASPKRVAVLPGAGEHYSVVFPFPRFEQPDTKYYEIHVFSSESRSWSSRVARISKDSETAADDAVAAHEPSKAVVAAEEMMSSLMLAWIDLGRGVLLCNVLDEDPVLRLLQWPVPPPRDGRSPLAARDATFSNGAIRFVESSFDGNGGWTVTVSKRETGSKYWYKCSKADIARILATGSSYSELLRPVWDEDDEATKRGFNKVVSASPTLSLSSEDVVHFTINLKSQGDSDEPLMLAVNAREGRVEAAEQSCVKGTCCPCTFFRCMGTDETSDLSDFSAEGSCVAPNRTCVQLGAFSFVVEHDKMLEDERVPPAADVMPSENIFMSGTMRKLEMQAIKEHKVQIGSLEVGNTI